MALSDCPVCWNTPCTCGHEYKEWSDKDIKDLVAVLERVLADRYKHLNIDSQGGVHE